ncbi:hypothetical protein ACFVH6_00800 [Spirillospora sp. NPDC127200]
MAAPDEGVARPAAAVLFSAVAVAHVLTLPEGFAAGVLVETRGRVWWYAPAEGLPNAAGTPNANPRRPPLRQSTGRFSPDGLALPFLSGMLTAPAARVLARRRVVRQSPPPGVSAVGRRVMPEPPPTRPPG